MKVTFVREDGTTFPASFNETYLKNAKKDTWVKEMSKIYADKGVEKEVLEAKLSEVYDFVKGKKPKSE